MVGLFDLVAGLFKKTHKATRKSFQALPSSHFNKSMTNTWPVDGCWGELPETAVLTDGDRDD